MTITTMLKPKEIGILFQGEMVRSLLRKNDPKTETRRLRGIPQDAVAARQLESDKRYERSDRWLFIDEHGSTKVIKCPYGQSKDILWVRETWASVQIHSISKPGSREEIIYRAENQNYVLPSDSRWVPSIHMPKSVCRIVLEVLEIRVERLQDITEEGAIAEGIEPFFGDYTFNQGLHLSRTPLESFWALWNSINSDYGNRWEDNPWVWVVKFQPVAS